MRDALGVTGGDADNTRFAGDTVVRPPSDIAFQGLDVKLEPSNVLTAVGAANVLASTSGVSIGTAPATKSGTPNFAPPPTP